MDDFLFGWNGVDGDFIVGFFCQINDTAQTKQMYVLKKKLIFNTKIISEYTPFWPFLSFFSGFFSQHYFAPGEGAKYGLFWAG